MSRALDTHADFIFRHIGPAPADQAKMLAAVGSPTLDALIQEVVPAKIRNQAPLALPASRSETDVLGELKRIAGRNKVYRNYIGQGYYGTHTPNVVLRNILENPAWYTAYTPYQPEISQGRLEALLNYQTMVADLTGLDISNASLLEEGTAAAEAMTLARRIAKSQSPVFFVSQHCHPQTLEVVRTRVEGLDIQVVVGNEADGVPECFGVLLQYPHSLGSVADYRALAQTVHAQGAVVACATDLLALALLTAPGEWGGGEHRHWFDSAFRRAVWFWRHARRFHGVQRCVQTQYGRPFGWRFERCARRPGFASGFANPRATYSPRESYLQYLHGASIVGGNGRHVCRLA
jgi:glycine dehydrogenase